MTVDLFGHYGVIGNSYTGRGINPGGMYYGSYNCAGGKFSANLNSFHTDTFVKKDDSKFYAGLGIATTLATIVGGLIFLKKFPKKAEALKKGLKKIFCGTTEKTATGKTVKETAKSAAEKAAKGARKKTTKSATKKSVKGRKRTGSAPETAGKSKKSPKSTKPETYKNPSRMQRLRARMYNFGVSVSTFLKKFFPI